MRTVCVQYVKAYDRDGNKTSHGDHFLEIDVPYVYSMCTVPQLRWGPWGSEATQPQLQITITTTEARI